MEIKKEYLNKSIPLIKMALAEDLGDGDKTTESILPIGENVKAEIIAKSSGIVCGLDVFKKVFEELSGQDIVMNSFKVDGDLVNNGDTIAELFAPYNIILSGERTALNFLQRMSGIATKTNKFVNELKGTSTKLLDTRKTIPGFRYLDKYSVKMGSGENHRFGLFDMVMLKDNHIEIAGSISMAVKQVREKYSDKYLIEVETKNLDEVKEALACNIDMIMLDNMNIKNMKECVNQINGKIKTEASGNVNINNVRQIAETGVDFISVGALTHSVEAFDISLLIRK